MPASAPAPPAINSIRNAAAMIKAFPPADTFQRKALALSLLAAPWPRGPAVAGPGVGAARRLGLRVAR
jgi:hypothetical protein